MSIKVRFATPKDFDRLLEIDSIYPEEWQVTKPFVEKAWSKNSQIYRVLEHNQEIQGFLAFFPIHKNEFEQLLDSKLDELNLCHFILPYEKNKSVYLYLANIIVNTDHELRKEFAKVMINEIGEEIQRIRNSGCLVNEVGAIAITKEGHRVLNKSNLEYIGHYLDDDKKHIYRGTHF
ncbi:hypothetical protein [Bacillus sp. AFS017336]|uniref:hypothetical protein n=1 Tax=Bacillus sp. AFS017336 TaxID=2033489 RepID=UPI000BEF54D2|nr:hypothetical protein [Bacillus sp. AFS017336]PEL14357.1 hypothetical protein CN601_00335 [Bacillus sp. AFS017336]